MEYLKGKERYAERETLLYVLAANEGCLVHKSKKGSRYIRVSEAQVEHSVKKNIHSITKNELLQGKYLEERKYYKSRSLTVLLRKDGEYMISLPNESHFRSLSLPIVRRIMFNAHTYFKASTIKESPLILAEMFYHNKKCSWIPDIIRKEGVITSTSETLLTSYNLVRSFESFSEFVSFITDGNIRSYESFIKFKATLTDLIVNKATKHIDPDKLKERKKSVLPF